MMAYRLPYHQSSYGHCDSYFVETDEGVFAQRLAAKERARAAARETQNAIAEMLSNITCDELQGDIQEHLERIEPETLPDLASIESQPEIRFFMRPYLLDFLIEAHAAFQLLPETLYLAVNLLDRYCSKRIVYKRHYQLVGCAAMLIAAKYGDRKERVPTIRELKSMCCSLYEEEMFTQMEWHVLVTLSWTIGHPTIDSFLQLAHLEDVYDPEVEHMTWYLCEISLYHQEFIQTPPSVMARSALALARCVLSRPCMPASTWSGRYDHMTLVTLAQKCQAPSQVLAKKYSAVQFSSAATSLERFLWQQIQLPRENVTTPIHEGQQGVSLKPETPHTPQKGPDQHINAYGLITPPITPEGMSMVNEHMAVDPKPCQAPTPAPTAWTPPSSAGQNTLAFASQYQHQCAVSTEPTDVPFFGQSA